MRVKGADEDREDGLTTRYLEIGFAPTSGLRSGRLDDELCDGYGPRSAERLGFGPDEE